MMTKFENESYFCEFLQETGQVSCKKISIIKVSSEKDEYKIQCLCFAQAARHRKK